MAKGVKKAIEAEEPETTQEAPVHYQEWRMERGAEGQLEKLKMLRPVVKISEEEAEVLNAGAQNGQGVIIQYFLPE